MEPANTFAQDGFFAEKANAVSSITIFGGTYVVPEAQKNDIEKRPEIYTETTNPDSGTNEGMPNNNGDKGNNYGDNTFDETFSWTVEGSVYHKSLGDALRFQD